MKTIFLLQRFGEAGVLGEEAEARVDRFRAGLAGVDDLVRTR